MTSELAAAEFARQFLAASAPPERVGEVVAQILGDRLEIGPLRVGPAGVAVARAAGVVGTINAFAVDDPEWNLRVQVPVHLKVKVRFAGSIIRYTIAVTVRTRIRLRLEMPCAIVVDIDNAVPSDVHADIEPRGLPGRTLGWIANINREVRDQVVAYFNGVLASPQVRGLLRFDVPTVLDKAWSAGIIIPRTA